MWKPSKILPKVVMFNVCFDRLMWMVKLTFGSNCAVYSCNQEQLSSDRHVLGAFEHSGSMEQIDLQETKTIQEIIYLLI